MILTHTCRCRTAETNHTEHDQLLEQFIALSEQYCSVKRERDTQREIAREGDRDSEIERQRDREIEIARQIARQGEREIAREREGKQGLSAVRLPPSNNFNMLKILYCTVLNCCTVPGISGTCNSDGRVRFTGTGCPRCFILPPPYFPCPPPPVMTVPR